MSILLAVLGRWEERSDACTIPEYKWINEQFENGIDSRSQRGTLEEFSARFPYILREVCA